MARLRLSNVVFYTINALSLLAALAAVAVFLYFRYGGGPVSVCQRAIRDPLLIAALLLALVSFLGLIGSCCRDKLVFVAYFVVVCLLVIGLCVFALFVLVVTSKSAAQKAKELGFDDYSGWLKKRFVYGKHWEQLRSCLAESNVCKSLHSRVKLSYFFRQHLSPIQSGCCKPPVYCGYIYKNATYWEMPTGGPKVADIDCRKWWNDKEKLCYDCQSCKRGVLISIRKEWRLMALLNITVLVLILITLNIAFCVYRNNHMNCHLHANNTTAARP